MGLADALREAAEEPIPGEGPEEANGFLDEVLPPLCAEQLDARDKIRSTDRQVIVLTGCAGSGKSVLMRHLIDNYPDEFSITSTTARSALNVRGVTVDRMFSIDRQRWKIRNVRVLEDNMKATGPYIIVDEASMVGMRMAKLLNAAVTEFHKKLILCGDWAQASPVKDDWPLGSALLKGAEFICLKECHRQQDSLFLSVLNDIRLGEVTPQAEDFFRGKVVPDDPFSYKDGVVKMYATNAKVDECNRTNLSQHTTETGEKTVVLSSSMMDLRITSDRHWTMSPDDVDKVLRESPLAHNEPLAKGCRVLVTHNVGKPEGGGEYLAVNGDSGWLVEMDRHEPVPWWLAVKLDRTGEVIRLPQIKLEYFGRQSKDPTHALRGYPIRLGYAVTVHKSQGMTLGKTEVDMASILRFPEEGRHGLAYVAFSRAKTPEGLKLLNWKPAAVFSNPDIRKLIVASSPRLKEEPKLL